jgi:hypothetical protein
MTRTKTLLPLMMLAAAGLGAVGCEQDKPQLAPAATELKAPEVKAPKAEKFVVDKASSKVDFMMEAPQEKIRGRAGGTAEGELQLDPTDLTRTTGLITVDISGIELFQAIASEDGKFGEEKKSDLQNQHARQWLEISDDAPAADRAKNSKVQFSIKSIKATGDSDISKASGGEKKVTVTATGDFLLHQRQTEKTVELEATFKLEGGKPVSVTVKTVKPFGIGLAEHDVHPREAFGKLAQKTLAVLAPKVAQEAMVSIELTAAVGAGGAAPAGAVEPAKATAK